jgi:hypothetical protein
MQQQKKKQKKLYGIEVKHFFFAFSSFFSNKLTLKKRMNHILFGLKKIHVIFKLLKKKFISSNKIKIS